MPLRNAHDLPKAGKIIALDVGEKTIGIAISDGLRLIAQPHTTLRHEKFTTTAQTLQNLATVECATCFVVGLPLHMNGSMSASADRATSFAHELEKKGYENL